MNSTNLPENNMNINIKLFILDPLSVIIKLAILGNKEIGTKILIQHNVIYFQEPGIFQSVVRYFYNTNKTDLQYMYNPIQIACTLYLKKETIEKIPRIKNLFICAQKGLKKLIETYKNCSIITLCLNYFYAIITNNLEQKSTDNIFYKDTITNLYNNELTKELNDQWTEDKIKVILDLITFLNTDNMAENNVKSLENIMETIDKNSRQIIMNI